MRVSVHIYAYLRYYLPAAEKSVQGTESNMPEGSTVTRLLGECVRVTWRLESTHYGARIAVGGQRISAYEQEFSLLVGQGL
jgi:hypothetical protein